MVENSYNYNMKIRFRLAWAKGPVATRHFKAAPCYTLFSGYLSRLSHYVPLAATGIDLKAPESSKVLRWFCHTGTSARSFTSEELAKAVKKMQHSGTKEWEIVIGPPDGFKEGDLAAWRPDCLWSFGPLTLPHELASVVAAEQVYRAYTILAGQPYHSGH